MAKDDVKSKDGITLETGEVDIDSLKIKVVILCLHKNKMDQVGMFLRRRGWEADIVLSLEEGIQNMTEKKPDFVLVSVNLPTGKLAVLPQFFAQTFNARCIVFAEDMNSKATSAIRTAPTPYKIMGPPSGPTVHRRIMQILQEMYPRAEDAKAKKGRKAGDFPMNQRFSKSESENGFEPVQSKKQKEEKAKHFSGADDAKLMGINNSSGNMAYMPDPEEEKPKKKTRAQSLAEIKKQWEEMAGESLDKTDRGMEQAAEEYNSKVRSSSEEPSSEKEELSIDMRQEKLKAKEGESFEAVQEKVKAMEGEDTLDLTMNRSIGDEASIEKEELKSKELSAELESLKGKEFSVTQSGPESKDINYRGSEEGDSSEPSATQEGLEGIEPSFGGSGSDEFDVKESEGQGRKGVEASGTSEQSSLAESSPAEPLKQQAVDEKKNKSRNNLPENKQFLYDSIDDSLRKSVKVKETIDYEIHNVSTMGVIVMQSQDLTGYLLLSCADTKFDMESFLKKFKQTLINKIESEGHEVMLENGFVINTESVDFDLFCAEKCEFNVVENHEGYEVIVGFHQRENPLPKISQKMGQVKSEIQPKDIKVEVPTTFDSYLYLVKNNKYFLFLRKGSFLLPKQRDRLDYQKVTLHIGRGEINAFNKFFVENIINDHVIEVNINLPPKEEAS